MSATTPSPSGAPNVGVGILCWRNVSSLEASLQSFERNGVFGAARETRLLLAEATEAGRALAARYPLDVDATDRNLGILGGFERLAQSLRSDNVLLLEDDCPLVEGPDTTRAALIQAERLLTNAEAQVVRLRSRPWPGAGVRFQVLDKHARYHGAGAAPRLRRLARPGKARRLLSAVPYRQADPWADPLTLAQAPRRTPDGDAARAASDHALTKAHPDLFRLASDGTLLVSAAIMPWSNQSVAVRRDFYLDHVAPMAREGFSRRRSTNGFSNVERDLNRRAWRRSGWWIALPRGLFAHELCA